MIPAKLVIAGLIAGAALLPGVAGAQTKGFYGSLAAGASLPTDADVSGSGINTSIDSDVGYGLAVAIGHDYGNDWRTEIELGYRRSSVDGITGASAPSGDLGALSFLIDGYRDIDTGSPWTPYLGLGLGGARVDYDGVSPIGASRIDDTAWVFAYQGIAGLAYRMSDTASLFLDYRYFGTEDAGFSTDSGVSVDGEYGEHRVLFGVRFSFGAPKPMTAPEPKPMPVQAPAPPPPAPPPAPPPPAPRAEPAPPPAPPEVRDYLVFFDWDKYDLTPEALTILRAAAENTNRMPVTRIEATGHADRSGPDTYNMGLSMRRAQSVRDELVRLGIKESEIYIFWKGEREPLVQTPDGVREPQNRRVEIILK